MKHVGLEVVGTCLKGDEMTIKLIATDMDGTCWIQESNWTARLKILDQLDERGIRLVIATGNEVHCMSTTGAFYE